MTTEITPSISSGPPPGSEPPRAGRHPRRRLLLILAAALVLVILVATPLVLRGMQSSAQTELDDAITALQARQDTASVLVDAATASVSGAEQALGDSAGKVLAEDTRGELTSAIAAVAALVAPAAAELDAATEAITDAESINEGFFSTGSALRDAASALGSMSFDASENLGNVAGTLDPPVARVTTAVAEWQAEQDRIIAARYTNNVHATGWYPELDACAGSVDITAHYADVPTIAEHWSCGGKNFPTEAGTIITLTGDRAGTYRVDGKVKTVNQHVATVADVPRGHDLLYQTCDNGQSTTMFFVALTKLA
ncbi:MAG: hypothetical protein JWQ43_3353 [Glaciihabitans sp.]|nr:hypothetical protein [Glaciihabitans sp.]